MHRPRIERIDHLTIAVPSLEAALDLWRDALGVSPDIRDFPEHQIREAAFPIGDLEVRLRQATGREPHDMGLRLIGIHVTGFDRMVEACCTKGLQLAETGPAHRPAGRRRTLIDADGRGPALELLEAHPQVVAAQLPRPSRHPRRQTPSPRVRGVVRRRGKTR